MTLVYYSSKSDWPKLEQEVRNTISRNSNGLPIVSVTHQPVDFGDNICVGDIGRSWESVFTQQKLGVERATTKYVAICESDFLLPPAFFSFRPPHDKIYCWPRDGYIAFQWKPRLYYRKRITQTVGVVGREHLLSILGPLFDSHGHTPTLERLVSRLSETGVFDMGSIVTLKTRRQMHLGSPCSRTDPVETLPEWGEAKQMWDKYL